MSRGAWLSGFIRVVRGILSVAVLARLLLWAAWGRTNSIATGIPPNHRHFGLCGCLSCPRVSRALWSEKFQVIQLFRVHENGNPCHRVWFAGFLRCSTKLTLSVHSAEGAAQNSGLNCGLSAGPPRADVAMVLPSLCCGTLGSFL